jgi:hypothetical protein
VSDLASDAKPDFVAAYAELPLNPRCAAADPTSTTLAPGLSIALRLDSNK